MPNVIGQRPSHIDNERSFFLDQSFCLLGLKPGSTLNILSFQLPDVMIGSLFLKNFRPTLLDIGEIPLHTITDNENHFHWSLPVKTLLLELLSECIINSSAARTSKYAGLANECKHPGKC